MIEQLNVRASGINKQISTETEERNPSSADEQETPFEGDDEDDNNNLFKGAPKRRVHNLSDYRRNKSASQSFFELTGRLNKRHIGGSEKEAAVYDTSEDSDQDDHRPFAKDPSYIQEYINKYEGESAKKTLPTRPVEPVSTKTRVLKHAQSDPDLHHPESAEVTGSSTVTDHPKSEASVLERDQSQVEQSDKQQSNQVCLINTDSDNDPIDVGIMESMGAQPEIFKGCLADDAESWLKFMDIWLETRRANLNDRSRMCYAATYFREAALTWFHSLKIADARLGGQAVSGGGSSTECNIDAEECRDDHVIKTYAEFREAFKERFKRQPEEEQEAVARLWEIRQMPGQTTESFVNKIRDIGNKVHASVNDQFRAAITGLREDIRGRTLVQGHPRDLDQLIRWGTNAESYKIIEAGPEVSKMASTISTINDTLAKLVAGQMTLRPLETAKSPEPRRRSPTPPPAGSSQKNVTWRDESEAPGASARNQTWNQSGFRGGNRGQQNRGRGGRGQGRPWNNNYTSNQYPQEGYFGGGNGNYGGGNGSYGGGNGNVGGGNGNFGGGRGSYGGGYNQQQQQPGRSASASYGYANNYTGNTSSRCPNCAKSHAFGECPARGTTCSSCGKPNHWRIACRSSRGRGRSY